MIEILEKINYRKPNIIEYNDSDLVVSCYNNNYELFVNGQKWNNYDNTLHSEVFQVFSHYYLAYGHCICTGLGFAIRENWLLNKSSVDKITVIENSSSVIDYHKKFNKHIFDKIEIIKCDANEFEGSCDTLLLDHYEQEDDEQFISSLQNISKNIQCKIMWPWSIEPIIDNDNKKLIDSYNSFRNKNNLYSLPKLTQDQINLFVSMFFFTDIIKHKKYNLSEVQYG